MMPSLSDDRGAAGSPTLDRGRSVEDEITLLELLDRVLDKGVVLSGEVTLSVADVDLVYLGLRVLLSSVEAAERMPTGTDFSSEGAGAGGAWE